MKGFLRPRSPQAQEEMAEVTALIEQLRRALGRFTATPVQIVTALELATLEAAVGTLRVPMRGTTIEALLESIRNEAATATSRLLAYEAISLTRTAVIQKMYAPAPDSEELGTEPPEPAA